MTTATTINFTLSNGKVITIEDPAMLQVVTDMQTAGKSDQEIMEAVLAFLKMKNAATGETPVAEETKTEKGESKMNQTIKTVSGVAGMSIVGAAGYLGKGYSVTKNFFTNKEGMFRKGVDKVWGGIKKIVKSMNKTAMVVGVASAIIGGAMTSTMAGAVIAGVSIAAVTMIAIELMLNKQRKEEQKKGFMAIASAALSAATWAALTPYALTYGLSYIARFFDWAWYVAAKSTIDFAVLFMA